MTDIMRHVLIYSSALTALASTSVAIKHEAAQLRDLLSYPKYEIQFLNDLPLSTSDADRAKRKGVEREDEWFALRFSDARDRLSDGSETLPYEVRDLRWNIAEGVGSIRARPYESYSSWFRLCSKLPLPHAVRKLNGDSDCGSRRGIP